MKTFFLTLSFIPFICLAQPDSFERLNPVESEFYILNSDDNPNLVFIYKIAYSDLVFEKNNNVFKAGYKVNIEISELSGQNIYREYKQHTNLVDEFDLTNNRDEYLEGAMQFDIVPGSYKLIVSFTDLNSKREYKNQPAVFSTDSVSQFVAGPVVVNSDYFQCDEKELILPANFSGTIPFNDKSYSILLPVKNQSQHHIYVEIINNGELIYNEKIDEVIYANFKSSECDENVGFLINPDKTAGKYFIIKKISEKLNEGTVTLNLKEDSLSARKEIYNLKVRWINKPNSLRNPGKSLEYLSLIAPAEEIEALYKASEEELPQRLMFFWEQFDPTPDTKFNELMSEFYSRIDYAEANFSALNNQNGAKSDRGKLYVQYGNPESRERFTDEYGRMVEVWTYRNTQNKFMFVDKKGTGNFTLIRN